MATYVVLYRFTSEGAKNIKETVKRAREVRRRNEELGFKIQALYWTQGRFDLVSVVEAPSDEAMMGAMMNVVGAGNVHSETLRAFSDADMERLLSTMS